MAIRVHREELELAWRRKRIKILLFPIKITFTRSMERLRPDRPQGKACGPHSPLLDPQYGTAILIPASPLA